MPHKPDGAPKPRSFVSLLGWLAVLTLAGCTMPGNAGDPAAPRPFLQQGMNITGARTGTPQFGVPGAGYTTLRRPVAVSARDNEVYLADAGLNRIFRYNRDQQTLTPFTNLSAGSGTRIYAAPDRSVYIIDPARAEVLHYAWDGTQLPSFISPGNLARPVSVAVDERTGQILVADGLFDQFIAFNSMGMTLSVIKPREQLAIAAMTTGPDGIYVTDRISRRVAVLGWDGAFRYAFGGKDLGDPGAIAVSRDNSVFVSDNFDQTIKVYRVQGTEDRGQKTENKESILVARFGGVGASSGSFNGIADLAVDGSLLYAADSLNARVHVMHINR
ncbi:MAG: hypothetical protein A2V79_05715 [Betaproteobacteria bacterium RBG_16_56_24]|nr:MAG: hypothetical protein A2V79_05715 [Betaproteobacteria bacterium RBG_16_56_24]